MPIIIGCDSFLSLRNVRNGNLGRYLEDLHVLVDPNQLEGSKAAGVYGARIGALIDFDLNRERALSQQFYRTYLARKAYYDGGTLWSELRSSSCRNHPEGGWKQRASLTMAGLRLGRGWVEGALNQAQKGRQFCAGALRQHPLVSEYRRLFDRIQPEAVVAFSLEGKREMLLLEAANEFDIPTAVMIRSRDNLAAKIQHLPDAAVYCVWSEVIRNSLLQMYPEIPTERIRITGSPQFDRHLDSRYRMGREAFFEMVGLDPEKPLVVYSMATPELIDHEIHIAQHLAETAHRQGFARGAQLLVRGHPRMFGSNVKLLERQYPEARVYPTGCLAAYRSPNHEAAVVRHILEDEPVHLAVLENQDVQVNVCGTMTIDSAILDKPTVNVYYDLVENVPRGLSVRRFYERSDSKQMMAYGASRLARSPEECIDLINIYLEHPALDADGRKRAREEDCGPLDGEAGRRIAGAANEIAWEKTRCLALS